MDLEQIQVGNISDSQAVAIGAGAKATINQYTEIIVKIDNLEEMPPAPGQPPYKGLAYYTEADADLFFGRETLTTQLLLRLQTTPFFALVGASGSGKSSLLRAGLLPQLRQQEGQIHVFTPTAHPLERLAYSLTREDDTHQSAEQLRTELATNPRTLRAVGNKLVSRQGGGRLLLVIDQFEELFTLCHDEREQRAFVDNLVTAVASSSTISILIGIRADFYGKCAQHEQLRELVAQHHYLLGPINQADIVRVIAEPAKRSGWQFVDGLVEQILEGVGQEPGRLPLLSHALLETWQRRRGVVMTLGGYRAAGGVEGAIAQTAEGTFQLLDSDQQRLAQHIFLALTELGEGSEDTRRLADRSLLLRLGEEGAVTAVLERLVTARLIAVEEQEVQVAHEALIRRWPRLQNWLDQNRERLRFERQLARDAELWRDSMARDVGALYRGARLAQAVEWANGAAALLDPLSQEFLTESRRVAAEEERERVAVQRKQLILARALTTTAVVILLLVIGIAIYPTFNNWQLQEAARSPLVLIEADSHSFQLEAHEVSNHRYSLCVEAGECSLPQDPTKGYLDPTKGDFPVEAVSAYEAHEYCEWIDRRLPTHPEWELAYQYAQHALDPPNLGNISHDSSTALLQPVVPSSIEPDTLYHLVGNVWEWTSTFDLLEGTPERHWAGETNIFCADSSSSDNCVPPFLKIVGGGVDTYDYDPQLDINYQNLFSAQLRWVGFRCAESINP